ncbi:MAG: sulfatase [Bacteroidetes bacterium]|nr:sulfatase [Bacteroidota bacterium]
MRYKIGLIAAFVALGIADIQCRNNGQRDNVLLIVIDDLNDYPGCFGGHPQARTPNIDRLALSGVRFTNAHANIGLCNPSRNSLFTGIYPHQSRNFGPDRSTAQALYKNNKTLMELFSENGYYVLGSGKLLHSNRPDLWDDWGVDVNNYGPFAFDGDKQAGHPSVPLPFRSIGDIDGSFAPLSDVPVFPEGEVKGKNGGWVYSGRDDILFEYVDENNRDLTPDELHAEWAVKRLQAMDAGSSDRPFFMGVGFVRPHTPLYAPKRFFDMFPVEHLQLPVLKEGDVKDTHYKMNYPDARTKNDQWYTNTSKGRVYYQLLAESYGQNEELALKHFLQAYLACVAFVDEQVGLVLDALNSSKFRENTVVILTSDHGWQMGQKQYLFKNSPWSSSTRIPLIFKAAGMEPGSCVDHPVSLIDIFPTLTDICQLTGDHKKNSEGLPLGGFSLKPFLEDPDRAFWEGPDGALTAIATDVVDYELVKQTFSYRTRNHRYIIYPNGQEELYDLSGDPNEWINIAHMESHAGVKKELKSKIRKMTGK